MQPGLVTLVFHIHARWVLRNLHFPVLQILMPKVSKSLETPVMLIITVCPFGFVKS